LSKEQLKLQRKCTWTRNSLRNCRMEWSSRKTTIGSLSV